MKEVEDQLKVKVKYHLKVVVEEGLAVVRLIVEEDVKSGVLNGRG